MKKQVHIARNGQVIGLFDADKISHSLETGQILPTDHFFNEASSSWLPIDQWKSAPEIRVRPERVERSDPKSDSGDAEEKPDKSSSRAKKRGGSKSKKKGEPGLLGWIACLFIIGVAAGLWVWSQSLSEQITILKEESARAKASEMNLKKVNDALNEVTPSGSIRGIIIYEPVPNQTAIVSGATVGLYPRAAVEKVLTDLESNPPSNFQEKIERMKSQLPAPLAVTLTDSNGRINLTIPAPGDYVLVASAAKGGGPDAMHFLWLAGFQATDRPSLMILLDEKNAISEKNPDARIRNVTGLAQGE